MEKAVAIIPAAFFFSLSSDFYLYLCVIKQSKVR